VGSWLHQCEVNMYRFIVEVKTLSVMFGVDWIEGATSVYVDEDETLWVLAV
jgi:hypothetical protein